MTMKTLREASRTVAAAGGGLAIRYPDPAGALQARGVSWPRLSAYCPQDDAHEALLTVRDTLAYVHRMSAPLPAAGDAAATAAYDGAVDAMLHLLGLGSCANVIMGNEQIRGVSGGQKRRVSIAEALMSGAPIICLDEP